MSYNINTWKTKKIDSLKIPLTEIQKLPDVEIELLPENKVCIIGTSEMFEIEGTLEGDKVAVSKIEAGGESSGSTWNELLACLRTSTGKLIATQVWERGDSITRLKVKDGIVEEEEIEI